jgi:hypothetical protein
MTMASVWAATKVEAVNWWGKAKAHPVVAVGAGVVAAVGAKVVSDAHKKRFR